MHRHGYEGSDLCWLDDVRSLAHYLACGKQPERNSFKLVRLSAAIALESGLRIANSCAVARNLSKPTTGSPDMVSSTRNDRSSRELAPFSKAWSMHTCSRRRPICSHRS